MRGTGPGRPPEAGRPTRRLHDAASGLGLSVLAVLAVLALPSEAWSQTREPCEAPAAAVRLDHVVLAVRDLDAASATFRGMGFTLKEGRRHPNGIRNRHAKLGDGSYLELLAVEGEPGDGTAAGYSEFVGEEEGGAFLALRAEPSRVAGAAVEAGVEAVISGGRGFTYLTSTDPDLAAAFFLRYERPVTDASEIVTHRNGARGIAEVRVEAGRSLGRLLEALGAVRCGADAEDTRNREVETFAVDGGRVTLLPPPDPPRRPRVVGVRLLSSAAPAGGRNLPPDRTHGVWLSFVPMPDPVPGAPEPDAGP